MITGGCREFKGVKKSGIDPAQGDIRPCMTKDHLVRMWLVEESCPAEANGPAAGKVG